MSKKVFSIAPTFLTNEDRPSRLTDLSGNGADVLLYNLAYTDTDGFYRHSINFDGVDSYGETLANAVKGLNTVDKLTMNIWLDVNSVPRDGNIYYILSDYQGENYLGAYIQWVTASNWYQVRFFAGYGNVSYTFYPPPEANKVRQFLVTFDFIARTVVLSGNYSSSWSNVLVSNTYYNALRNPRQINIGRRSYIGTKSNYFKGTIYKVELYNDALTSQERTDYNTEIPFTVKGSNIGIEFMNADFTFENPPTPGEDENNFYIDITVRGTTKGNTYSRTVTQKWEIRSGLYNFLAIELPLDTYIIELSNIERFKYFYLAPKQYTIINDSSLYPPFPSKYEYGVPYSYFGSIRTFVGYKKMTYEPFYNYLELEGSIQRVLTGEGTINKEVNLGASIQRQLLLEGRIQ